MYYELDILADLILNKLNPLKPCESSSNKLEEWLNIAHNENCKIRTRLLEDALQLPDEQHVKMFIHTLQKRLTILANVLYNYVGVDYIFVENTFDESLSPQNSRKITYFIVEDLLSFIREHFERFFNLDEKPTHRLLFIATLKLSKNIVEVKSLYDGPNKFFNVLQSTLQESIKHSERLTYRKISYFEQLFEDLMCSKDRNDRSEICALVILRLIYFNFNSDLFFSVLTEEFKFAIDQIESTNEKIEKLSLFLKDINQAQIHPELIYHPSQIPIKDQLASWLINEMDFYEKKMLLPIIGEKETIQKFNSGQKVNLDASVEELAYFLRIMFDLKVFKDISAIKLTDFYAAFFNTKKANDLSVKNLNKEFYAINERTKEKVRILIIRMLNYTQKNNSACIILSTSFVSYFQEPLCLILS